MLLVVETDELVTTGGSRNYDTYGAESMNVMIHNLNTGSASSVGVYGFHYKVWDFDYLRTSITGWAVADQAPAANRTFLYGSSVYAAQGFSKQAGFRNTPANNGATIINGSFVHTSASFTFQVVAQWLNPAATTVLMGSYGSGTGVGYELGVTGTGVLYLKKMSSALTANGPTLTNNGIYDIVVVNDPSTNQVRFYLNGVLQTTVTGALTAELVGTSPFVAQGGRAGGVAEWSGYAGQFGMWTTVVSATPIGTFDSSLLTYYRNELVETLSIPANSDAYRQYPNGATPMPGLMWFLPTTEIQVTTQRVIR